MLIWNDLQLTLWEQDPCLQTRCCAPTRCDTI